MVDNIDSVLKTHPEHVSVIVDAFAIYATKNGLQLSDVLKDITTYDMSTLRKMMKKSVKQFSDNKVSRPITGYSYFVKDNFAKVKKELLKGNEKIKISDVSKAVSEKWKALPLEMRKKYDILGQNEKDRYDNEVSQINYKIRKTQISKPKRPQTAFLFFLTDMREKLKNENLKQNEISKQTGIAWKTLNKKLKEKYNYLSKQDQLRYEKENKNYKLLVSGCIS